MHRRLRKKGCTRLDSTLTGGYFDRLEALQGHDHTYYAGELLNFSSVDQSAWYAKTLIERFF